MRSRAKQHLPSVLLTLLSIIQALALELLWSRLHASPFLWNGGWGAVVGWLQIAGMFLGILQIWFFYTSLVLRFQWLPSFRDSLIPFVIGILEFSMIELLGPSRLGAWFLTLAAVFAVSVVEGHSIFRRARRDPANREFFDTVDRATRRDHMRPAAIVVGIAAIGALLQITGDQRWLASVALLLANGALLYQIAEARRYWDQAMSGEED